MIANRYHVRIVVPDGDSQFDKHFVTYDIIERNFGEIDAAMRDKIIVHGEGAEIIEVKLVEANITYEDYR